MASKKWIYYGFFFCLLIHALFLALGGAVAAPAGKELPAAAGREKGNTREAAPPVAVPVDYRVLGCVLPLTGSFAPYGNRALDTIILAAGLFEQSKRSPVKLLIEDSQSRPEKVKAAVAKLARAGVIAIIGSLGSEEAQAAAEEAQRLKVSLLTLTQKEGITNAGHYVFRNYLTGSQQVKTLANYARVNLPLRRFAVLHPEDDYAKEMVKLFEKEIGLRQGRVVWVQSYKSEQKDFSEEVRKLASETEVARNSGTLFGQPAARSFDFDALFIPDSGSAVKLIAAQLAFHEVRRIHLLGLNGWHSQALLSLEKDYLEKTFFTDGFFVDSPQAIDFVEAFYTAYGREPDVMEAEVFDSAGMAVKIILEKKGETRDKFREALAGLKDYPGVTGRTSFSATRDAEKEAFVLMVKGGKVVQVK